LDNLPDSLVHLKIGSKYTKNLSLINSFPLRLQQLTVGSENQHKLCALKIKSKYLKQIHCMEQELCTNEIVCLNPSSTRRWVHNMEFIHPSTNKEDLHTGSSNSSNSNVIYDLFKCNKLTHLTLVNTDSSSSSSLLLFQEGSPLVSLPPSLKVLRLSKGCSTLPKFLCMEKQRIQTLEIDSPIFTFEMGKITLNQMTSLTHLLFHGCIPSFPKTLADLHHFIPDTIKYLRLPDNFDGSITCDQKSKISSYTTLVVGCSFNHPLPEENNQWPSSTLMILDMSKSSFNRSIANTKWPNSLRKIKFGDHFDKSLNGLSGAIQLTTIETGNLYNETLINVTLPSSLKTIRFGDRFDQTLALKDNVLLPRGLQNLYLGFCFRQPLRPVKWPVRLRKLHIYGLFNASLPDAWPKSLQHLTLGKHFDGSLRQSHISESLVSFELLNASYVDSHQSLSSIRWPETIETLVFPIQTGAWKQLSDDKHKKLKCIKLLVRENNS